jgi:hypothetical protein
VSPLPAPVEEEIAIHRKASANDGAKQCAAYTDDRGENRCVHATGYGVVNPKPLGKPYIDILTSPTTEPWENLPAAHGSLEWTEGQYSRYPNSIPDFLNLRTFRQRYNRKKIEFAKGNMYRVVSSAHAHLEHHLWEGSFLLRDDDARQNAIYNEQPGGRC